MNLRNRRSRDMQSNGKMGVQKISTCLAIGELKHGGTRVSTTHALNAQKYEKYSSRKRRTFHEAVCIGDYENGDTCLFRKPIKKIKKIKKIDYPIRQVAIESIWIVYPIDIREMKECFNMRIVCQRAHPAGGILEREWRFWRGRVAFESCLLLKNY